MKLALNFHKFSRRRLYDQLLEFVEPNSLFCDILKLSICIQERKSLLFNDFSYTLPIIYFQLKILCSLHSTFLFFLSHNHISFPKNYLFAHDNKILKLIEKCHNSNSYMVVDVWWSVLVINLSCMWHHPVMEGKFWKTVTCWFLQWSINFDPLYQLLWCLYTLCNTAK